jgi:hypothetical protein
LDISDSEKVEQFEEEGLEEYKNDDSDDDTSVKFKIQQLATSFPCDPMPGIRVEVL